MRQILCLQKLATVGLHPLGTQSNEKYFQRYIKVLVLLFHFHFTVLYPCEVVKMRINIHSILVMRKFCFREAN